MYKKVKLVMLPTNEKSNIWLRNNKLEYNCSASSKINPQHLYMLSNDKPLKNDWILDIKNAKKPRQIKTEHLLEDLFETEKKIIATTNNNININLGKEKWVAPTNSKNDMVYTRLCPFPNLSFLFIQHYIEQYNIGNVITEVEVEYFTDIPVISDKEYNMVESGELSYKNTNPYNIDILKLNTDNTINIKPLKNSWTRKEIIEYGKLAFEVGRNFQLTGENNLKEIENNL